MSLADDVKAPIRHADRFFIGGQWVQPSSDATIKVIDSGTEELFFSVAEAQAADISRAVGAAREAFDSGPWPRLTHAERAGILRAIGAELARRSDDIGEIWPRESGVLHAIARFGGAGAQATFNAFADLAGTFAFEEPAKPAAGSSGCSSANLSASSARSSRGTPRWALISNKVAPALLAGCTVILKSSPEAPGEGYLIAEAAEAVGPAAGRAQRGDRRPGGLRVAGPRPAGGQDHLHRVDRRRTADRVDLRRADRALHAGAGRQVRRGDPGRHRHRDRRADPVPGRVLPVRAGLLLADQDRGAQEPARRAPRGSGGTFSQVRVGDPFDAQTQMGPLVASRQRDRVEGYIAQGIADGFTLATGGGRPKDLDRGWFVEPTVFGNVDNSSVIAQEEIFGPVLSRDPGARTSRTRCGSPTTPSTA